MRRRWFLGGAGGALLLGSVAGLRLLNSSESSAIVKVLHKRLAYLKLDPQGVAQFASDLASRQVISGAKLKAIDATGLFYTGLTLNGDDRFSRAIRHGEDRVTTAYLISTDFFINGADENRVVKYLGFFYARRPCSNPFARPVETPA